MLKFPKEENNNTRKTATNSTQGITARRGGLYRLATHSLLILLLPMLAGFAYLALVREPAQKEQQIDRIAVSFAAQQATNIHHLERRLRARIHGAAQSSLALAAIRDDVVDSADLAKSLRDFFPEALNLRIIPIGDMGTAPLTSGSYGLLNHIEVDLVRRAADGAVTQAESFEHDGMWLTTVAERVGNPSNPERRGVVVLTIDNKLLERELASLHPQAGSFTIEQKFQASTGREKSVVIASVGDGAADGGTRYVEIPDTSWRVAFTPSVTLIDTVSAERVSLIAVLLITALAGLAGMLLLIVRFPKLLQREVDRITAAADTKLPLELELPELVNLAKQLRRATLKTLRQPSHRSSAPSGDGRELNFELNTTPGDLLQTDHLLLEEGDEVLELDLHETPDYQSLTPLDIPGFPGYIFRAYDIRGVADTELTDELISSVGAAVGTIAQERGQQTLIVGCDGRKSSPRIKATLIRALMASGRDVIDLGMVSTPQLYFATHHLESRSGIMVTGSHNPAEHNGLKIVIDSKTIAAGGIQEIRKRASEGVFSTGAGRLVKEDINTAYADEILGDIAISVPLKIVVDAGNGATSPIAPILFEDLGCEVIPLYCEVDGSFPNHAPDTSNESNLADLQNAVVHYGADFGVAFDGDGDRLAVVTGSGRIVRSDLLMMIYAHDVVSRNPGADVVFDVKCSRQLSQVVSANGGRPVLWKTGHAFMKEKIAETGALLGGEFSGHIFFGERWFGFDDGIYAAARLAEILSTYGQSLDEVIAQFPESVNTPEILVPIAEQDKFQTIHALSEQGVFPSGKINTLDGIRVDFDNGWGLLRASNTSAALTARFEANTETELADIQKVFRDQLRSVSPALDIPF
jgi:phosphomannomutase / phosphoglucomutase